MRRSGAPSQLLGNATKKPRFVPPGASTSCLVAESKPLSPKLGLRNALDKVNTHLQVPIIPVYHLMMFKHAQIISSPLTTSCTSGPEKSSSTSSQYSRV